MAFGGVGEAEIDAARVICFGGCGQIEIGERNFLRMLRSEVPQCLSYDGVILDFLFALIAENQHRGGGGFRALWNMGRRRSGTRVRILIALVAHVLFFKTLLVHLVRQAELILLVLVIGRTRIPPPVRINSTEPRVAITATESKAIVSEAAGAEPQTHPRMAEAACGKATIERTAHR